MYCDGDTLGCVLKSMDEKEGGRRDKDREGERYREKQQKREGDKETERERKIESDRKMNRGREGQKDRYIPPF